MRLGDGRILLGAGCLLVGSIVTGLAFWNLKPTSAPKPRPVTRTVVALPSGERLDATSRPAMAVSPDGSNIAYAATRGDAHQLYLRTLDSLEAKPIPGTEGAFNPFFSPDGQWLGFFAGGKLKKVSVNGGAALTLTDASAPLGASWSSQGMIVFAPVSGGPLQQVSAAGGSPKPLTQLEKGEGNHRWPEFLPGGNAVLFNSGTTVSPRVAVYSIATGKRQDLIEGALYPKYSPTGHLLYVQGGTLMAVPFDSQKLQLTGAAFPVVENVLEAQTSGVAHYDISDTGSLIYISGGVEATQKKFVWVSRNGTEQPLPAPAHAYSNPRFSPDGRKIAVELREQGIQVWLYDMMRQTLTRFTLDGTDNRYPAWTPDGKRIAFASNTEGTLNIFWQPADRSGGVERLYKSDFPQYPSAFSSDGQLLAFIDVNPDTGFDIGVLRLSDHKGQPFSGHASLTLHLVFLRTVAGWLMFPMNPAGPRFMFSHTPGRAGNGRFQPKAARSQCGIGMAESYFIAARTR